jgi:hypothetical protein
MTLEEEHRLVQRVMDENLIIGCYVDLLGETGLRKTEGLKRPSKSWIGLGRIP